MKENQRESSFPIESLHLAAGKRVEANLKVLIPFSFYRQSEIIPTYYTPPRIMGKRASFTEDKHLRICLSNSFSNREEGSYQLWTCTLLPSLDCASASMLLLNSAPSPPYSSRVEKQLS